MNISKFEELCNILAPLNATQGEHSVTIEIWAGTELGMLNVRLDYKTEIFEVAFCSLDRAILRAKEIVKKVGLDSL